MHQHHDATGVRAVDGIVRDAIRQSNEATRCRLASGLVERRPFGIFRDVESAQPGDEHDNNRDSDRGALHSTILMMFSPSSDVRPRWNNNGSMLGTRPRK